jgi:tyrosyl-tRNA synthetase
MWNYYELATDRTETEIGALKSEVASGKLHPMDAKMKLGEEVVSTFHGAEAGRKAADNFQRVFRDRQAPTEMKEILLKRMPMGFFVRRATASGSGGSMVTDLPKGSEKWSKLLAYLGEASSASEVERVMKQGGFEVDGQTIQNPAARLDLTVPAQYAVRLGKKNFLRVVVK